MASVGASGGPQSGRRSLDAEINLVPFIDLLSMCICFLLMTAVWIQIGALEVKQSRGTEVEPMVGNLEMDLKFVSPTAVELGFSRKGARKETIQAATFPELVAAVDARLEASVKAASGSKDPNATAASLVGSAMVTPTRSLSYGDLVGMMDLLRRHRIVNLGVVPVGG